MVLTHRHLEVPPALVDVVEPTGLTPAALLRELGSRSFTDVKLDHVDTVVFENGCVQTRHRVQT